MKIFNTLIAAIRLRAIESSVFRAGNVLSITVALGILLALSTGIKSVSAQPTISSFEPISGPIGTSVTITGSNFNANPTANIVYFGAVRAEVTAASPTSLSVTVPIGVTYQPITVTNNKLTAYSAQPFVVTFVGGTNAFTLGSFSSKIDFATSSNPYQVMTGDLDGDGRTDIITGNLGKANFSVLKNSGTSGTVSFSNTVLYSTGNAIYSPKYIADLDGDGKLDIAFAVQGNDIIKVYKNMCSADNIILGEPQNFLSGNAPAGVAFGDINSDGKIDMVSNNFEANTFSVFINNSSVGNISFASKIDFATSANPRSVLIADFNNDGKPDILFVNIFGTNTISVFRNTSDENIISFAAKVEFPTNNADPYMAVGDLDGDNMTDIVVANLYSGSISIFRNTSTNGVINFASKVDFTTVSGAYDISIGDLNGDGKPDLAVLCASSNIVSIFKNTCTVGTLSFAENVDFSTGSYPTGITIGDFDSDGLSDIAVANQSSTFFSVLRNQINTSEPSCLIPSGLTTTNIMSNSIELYWDDNPDALGYVIKYNTDAGGDNAKVTYSKSNAKPISGLLPGTTYFWRVKSVCSDDPKVVSEWSEKNYFTTTPLRMGDEQETSMEIYPNPASDKFMLDLRFYSTTNQPASIYIMNTLSQVVYSSVETVGNGEMSEGLLTEKKVITMPSTVSSGWYVVRVVMSDQVIEKKLLYQK